ncbi:Hypothetical predicted protein, partial [Olea europaea subsp. europaea]
MVVKQIDDGVFVGKADLCDDGVDVSEQIRVMAKHICVMAVMAKQRCAARM